MQKLMRIGGIIGQGLRAALCGGLIGGIVGSLSFGLLYMFFLWCFGRLNHSGPFLQSNTWFGFYLGNNLGIAAGAMTWFWPGLLRSARRLVFPWRRMVRGTVLGAAIGAFITALNAGLILVYAAKTRLPSTPADSRDFLGAGRLPHRVGPFISMELPLFMMILGLLFGVLVGAWWDTRKPRRHEEMPLTINGAVGLEPI